MNHELSKEQKVLLALYRLYKEGRNKVRYEDIVVRVFKDYPNDFHLKGYPEFPDTGDAVHKPLYDYRKRGMVSASNKMFSVTAHGAAEAERLNALARGQTGHSGPAHRLERDAQIEVQRIRQLDGFKLFLEGKREDIIDSDLFDYLGVSVRSTKNEFIGRLETMKSAIASVLEADVRDPALTAACQFHDFLLQRFAGEIAIKTGRTNDSKTGGIS